MGDGDAVEVGELIAQRYRVEATLGQGGFGTTYQAVDEQTGDRVAVKALDLSRVADWKAVELFEREAQTLRGLDHPNIPDYLAFIPIRDDESGYLVQSLAPGTSLDKYLAEGGRFDEARLHGLAVRTLAILEYLGSLNPPVVHRDLKPGNLLYHEGAIHLVDFGAVQDAAERTISGGSTVAGTFGYMAPEQLHGVASPASDLYGLGMTLIHLASSKHPSTLPRDGLRVRFHGDVALSERLMRLIERLVEPDPNDRFQSAAEALEFLHENEDGQDRSVDRGEVVCPNCGRVNGRDSAICRGCAADLTSARREVEKSFGPDMKTVLATREREEEEQRRREVVKRRKELNARRTRVAVKTTSDEFLLSVRPRVPWSTIILVAGFLLVNPGVFIVGGFPFLGEYWPFLAGNWVARTVVWVLFMLGMTGAYVTRTRRPWRIRLDRQGHFMRYRNDPQKPLEVGKFTDVSVSLYSSDKDVGVDAAELTLSDEFGNTVFNERFDNLSETDARLVNSVAEWEGFGTPKVTLYDPAKNESDERSTGVPAGREGWWRAEDEPRSR